MTETTTADQFPPRILQLLREAACREPVGCGAWQDENGDPLQDDADAALAWIASRAKDGWISVDDRLPMKPEADATYAQEECIVTDGVHVTTCGFSRGNGCGKPWADWSTYGGIRARHITHWQPLPPPPAARAKEGKA